MRRVLAQNSQASATYLGSAFDGTWSRDFAWDAPQNTLLSRDFTDPGLYRRDDSSLGKTNIGVLMDVQVAEGAEIEDRGRGQYGRETMAYLAWEDLWRGRDTAS